MERKQTGYLDTPGFALPLPAEAEEKVKSLGLKVVGLLYVGKQGELVISFTESATPEERQIIKRHVGCDLRDSLDWKT